MPVIEVLNLPMMVPEEIKRLRKEIIEAVTSLKILGLEDETHLFVFFPLCALQYCESRTERLVKIWGQEDTPALSISRSLCQKFAKNVLQVVSNFFPDDKVCCYVNRYDDVQVGCWINEEKTS